MINGTAEQFQKFATDYNKMVMEGWQNVTKQTIQSDAFASASGAFMDWSLATHKMMTELSGQVMESMDIPKRSDLARISAQVQAVETRLLDQEDHAEEIRDLLTTLIQKIDNLPAPAAPASAAPAAPVVDEKAETVDEKPPAKKTASKSKKKTASQKTSKQKESK